jgi:hypothetical protein
VCSGVPLSGERERERPENRRLRWGDRYELAVPRRPQKVAQEHGE